MESTLAGTLESTPSTMVDEPQPGHSSIELVEAAAVAEAAPEHAPLPTESAPAVAGGSAPSEASASDQDKSGQATAGVAGLAQAEGSSDPNADKAKAESGDGAAVGAAAADGSAPVVAVAGASADGTGQVYSFITPDGYAVPFLASGAMPVPTGAGGQPVPDAVWGEFARAQAGAFASPNAFQIAPGTWMPVSYSRSATFSLSACLKLHQKI